MAKIAVLLADCFVDVEYAEPAAFIKGKGHKLVHVGPEAGKIVRGRERGTEVTIDLALQDVSADPFDALLIPRGCTFEDPGVREQVGQWLRAFWQRGKPVFVSRRLASSGGKSFNATA
jgi:putative intracellular protease/amidase